MTDEQQQQPDTEPELVSTPAERWPRPVHYWCWAVCVGICLTDGIIWFVLYTGLDELDVNIVVILMFSSVSVGSALFGWGLFIVRRLSGNAFLTSEGAFLLLTAGVETIFSARRMGTTLSPIYVVLGDIAPAMTDYASGFTSLFTSLILIVALRQANTCWRIVFTICIVANLYYGLIYQSILFELAYDIKVLFNSYLDSRLLDWMAVNIPPVIIFSAALSDLIRKREIGWTHWFGIAAFLWWQAHEFVFLYVLGFGGDMFEMFKSLWPF